MSGLTLSLVLAGGLSIFVLHAASLVLAKALRTYSRSRLEAVCAAWGRPERIDAVAHLDERTERGAEVAATLSGLVLLTLILFAAQQLAPRWLLGAWIATVVAAGLVHLVAGVAGRVFAETVICGLWPTTGPLRVLTAPFLAVSRGAEAMAYRIARRSTTPFRPASVEVEIHSAVEEPDDLDAELADSTREMLEQVVELSRTDVSEIMIPRSAILALPATVSATEAAATFRESGRSRIPIYGANRDDIVGILYGKDLFAAMTATEDPALVQPRKLARPPFFVPETKNADELVNEFRTHRTQMAIVLDEYGAVAGLITLEDLLEELVGPIDDEHDPPTREDTIFLVGDSRYEVEASVPLEELNERLGLHLPTNEDFLTLGGLAFHALGRVPEPGESFLHEGIEFTVIDVADHSIRRLRLDLQPAKASVGGEGSR